MDRQVHDEHFSKFLETFHADADITIVPCLGFNSWDPDYSATRKFMSNHNQYIANTTVILLDNVLQINDEITIDGITTSLATHLMSASEKEHKGLIHEISQINKNRVHLVVDKSSVILGQKFIDKYLEEVSAKLDEESKMVVFTEGILPIWSGKDASLPSTITTYKEKLTHSTKNPWIRPTETSTDTLSTAESTAYSGDRTKVSDLESKISYLTNSKAQLSNEVESLKEKLDTTESNMTTDLNALKNQFEISSKETTDNINTLTKSLSTLTSTLEANSDKITEQSLSFCNEIETSLQAHKMDQQQAAAALRKEVNETVAQRLEEQKTFMNAAILTFHSQIMSSFPSEKNTRARPVSDGNKYPPRKES